jgi:hypothetical protein
VDVPTGVVAVVVTVSVAEPGTFTELWLNEAVAPAGSPLALRLAAPVKPAEDPTFTVYVVLAPFDTA